MLSRDYDTFSHLFLFLQKRATAAKFLMLWSYTWELLEELLKLSTLNLSLERPSFCTPSSRNFTCAYRIKGFCAIKKLDSLPILPFPLPVFEFRPPRPRGMDTGHHMSFIAPQKRIKVPFSLHESVCMSFFALTLGRAAHAPVPFLQCVKIWD